MPLAFERALRRPSPRALATHPAALAGNALTDGRLKYIYRAWRGDEQLFNLSADPTESRDLAGAPAYTAVLADWRRRMVAQFEREGRGPEWVMEGKLVVREQGQTYGPNFPQAPPPRPGDRIVMRPNGGGVDCNTNDCWLLVDSASGTALKLIGTADEPTGQPLPLRQRRRRCSLCQRRRRCSLCQRRWRCDQPHRRRVPRGGEGAALRHVPFLRGHRHPPACPSW